ncbi:CotH kinase family protein [Rossellomorea sp. NPDC077527]|uniref:CotH kinase family protein n=1 Tax=Rossellomorea sp. NPDC077527 TaxID=3364510 RepID=UPI0037CAEC48
MPIKTKWIISIMIAAILFTIGAIYSVQELQLEKDSAVYSYNEKLFNEEDVSTIEINMEDDQWEDLLANPLDEEYKEASITINGEKVSNVAVRTKGNSSLTSVARDESERYSLKIDFNYYDSTQSFYGLKKLNLNNNFSDSTQMKEFVSYELMEQMGVATPAHSYMKVIVNGEYYGLMLGVEAIDETFIAQHYQTTQGYLYKPDGTGSDLIYTSDDLEDYEGIEVKTNEDSVEDSELISMLKAINEEDGYEEYLNTDQLLRYFAMNTALVSLDSYQGQLKHNYYLYEDENGVFSILPWDYNMAFGGFNMGGNGGPPMDMNGANPNESGAQGDISPQGQENAPDDQNQAQENGVDNPASLPAGGNQGGGMMMPSGDLLSENTINFSVYEPVSGTSLSERPLLNVLVSDEKLLAQYETFMEQIATEVLTEENVASITTKLGALLEPYIESDPSKFFTTEEFLEGVSGDNSLPEFAKQRSESILAQLSGDLVVEADNTTGMSGMEGQDQNREQPQNGAPPQMNGGMRGGLDINSMTDEEFAQFVERIQTGNSPFSLPEDFDSMTIEEQKSYLAKQMGGMGGPPGAGGDGNDRSFPMNNEAKDSVSEEPTGEYTKADVYILFAFLAITAVAITIFRRIGR